MFVGLTLLWQSEAIEFLFICRSYKETRRPR